jgi:hypothetical protein
VKVSTHPPIFHIEFHSPGPRASKGAPIPLEREREREREREADRQTDRKRQIDSHTDRQTDRQTCAASTGAPLPLELDDTAGDASVEGAAAKGAAAASLPNIPARPLCAVPVAETWERADGELCSDEVIGGRDAREGLGGGLTE